jgi:hypothetical protein
MRFSLEWLVLFLGRFLLLSKSLFPLFSHYLHDKTTSWNVGRKYIGTRHKFLSVFGAIEDFFLFSDIENYKDLKYI